MRRVRWRSSGAMGVTMGSRFLVREIRRHPAGGGIPQKVFVEMKLPVGRTDMHEIQKTDVNKALPQIMSNSDAPYVRWRE